MKNLYFRRVRPPSLPLSEVLRDILIKKYWPHDDTEGGHPSEIILKRDIDGEYLKGLADAGTPGADLLLGVIEADAQVAIWIGE
jgi:hypothetical protein